MIGGFKHAWVARDQATILYICLLRCAQLAGAAHQASCAARSSLVLRTRLPALALRIVEVWAAAQLLKSTLRAFYFIHS